MPLKSVNMDDVSAEDPRYFKSRRKYEPKLAEYLTKYVPEEYKNALANYILGKDCSFTDGKLEKAIEILKSKKETLEDMLKESNLLMAGKFKFNKSLFDLITGCNFAFVIGGMVLMGLGSSGSGLDPMSPLSLFGMLLVIWHFNAGYLDI